MIIYFRILLAFIDFHFLNAELKLKLTKPGPSTEILIRLFRPAIPKEFLKLVLIIFCLLNPLSHSTVETGATSNLPAASEAAGYTSLCRRARLAMSLDETTDLLPLSPYD